MNDDDRNKRTISDDGSVENSKRFY